jgi:hypothetical protein
VNKPSSWLEEYHEHTQVIHQFSAYRPHGRPLPTWCPRHEDHIGDQGGRLARTAPQPRPATPLWLHGICQGQAEPLCKRGPLAPSPALSRVNPSSGNAANTVFACRWHQPNQTYSLARDHQRISLGLRFQSQAQSQNISVHAVARNFLGRSAHCSIYLANAGLIAKRRSSGMPTCRQRARSLVHSSGG